MAYATSAEIITLLRVDPSAFSVTEVDKLVEDAIEHLREASGTPADQQPPETATAREFVSEYASGHALKRALQSGSGVVDAEEAASLLKRADKLLERYDARQSSEAERTAREEAMPQGYSGVMDW